MADILVPFHTYPHVDQYQTGQRSARNLLRLLKGDVRPTTACVHLPMLVRGDELLTATGKFGEATGRCAALEQEAGVLAAGVIIGNAFTDVPALQSHVLVTTENDQPRAEREATRIAQFMWRHREIFQARLTPLDEALRLAAETDSLTVLSDGADATASGASGDSNAILRGLLKVGPACRAGLVISSNLTNEGHSEKEINEAVGETLDGDRSASVDPSQSDATNQSRPAGGTYWALIPIVDSPAVAAAFECGVRGTCKVTLGGTRDPGRFEPLLVEAYVKSLHDGEFRYEDGTAGRAGRTAVLVIDAIYVLVTERPVYVVGRRVFQAHGLEPLDFGLVVVKSPNGYRTWYEQFAARMIPVDVPGSTSANLRSLPYRRCVRPIFPLDEVVVPAFPTDDNVTLDWSDGKSNPREEPA